MFKLIKIGNHHINGLEEYHSVQFYLNGKRPSYLYRLRNNSSNRPYILVKEDSSVFSELNVGDILDMEFNQPGSLAEGKLFKTLIHSKIPHDRYAGYSIVELSILGN